MLLLYLSLILSLINIFCLGGSSQKSSFLRILETRLLILLLLSTFKKLIFARLIFVDFRVFFGKFTKNLILQSYIELVPVLKNNILLLWFALIFGNFATTYSLSTMSTVNKTDEYSNHKRVHPNLSNFERK